MDEHPYSLGARWILSLLGDPLENHWINIADGKIESFSVKPAYPLIRHLGEHSVVLPRTISAHAHLELSQLEAPLNVPSRSMHDWVSALLAFRQSKKYNAAVGIQKALRRPEFVKSTAAVADIVPFEQTTENPHSSYPINKAFPKGEETVLWLPFTELIGWRKDLVPDSVPTSFGLSPHAPHTVCPTLLEKAIDQNVPVAMHLAETLEELQLLRYHTGPLLTMMQHADADYDPKFVLLGKRPLDYLQLLSSAPSVFIIHGNYLDDEELQFLAAHRDTMSVVYCPRSHAYFRHSAYPLQKMLDKEVRVLLGTDSLASVSDLNLLEDMHYVLEHHPGVPPDVVYRMGTVEGASALNLLQEGFGTLQLGNLARFACFYQ